jgi:hypothetical protein
VAAVTQGVRGFHLAAVELGNTDHKILMRADVKYSQKNKDLFIPGHGVRAGWGSGGGRLERPCSCLGQLLLAASYRQMRGESSDSEQIYRNYS